jgi:hypothetical protein
MSHIIIKVYSFSCDYLGCDTEPVEITGYATLAEAREELTDDLHWISDRLLDWCPKH